ncbi:MAG: AbrB/MazE/SpoVT family DNA-binding domain-containing protein [Patescibacteria group bacterium]|nr:AbrB/MazE/SpoVT family DNA-binding domain-containing protein [Patescibacteria group bacterium]
MEKFIMKLRRVSTHSYAVTIPKELIKKFGWRERQKLELSFGGRKEEITIKDWKKKKNRIIS